jgi:hypothetical protein
MTVVDRNIENGIYLVLIYLVISGNYLGNLFGCRVQELFHKSMAMKHLLGLFTAYFLIILASPPENYSPMETIALSASIYFWFFLTTKMHYTFWIPMMVTALAAFFLYNYKRHIESKEEEKKDRTWMLEMQKVFLGISAVSTILGTLAYYGEKKIEYGAAFSAWDFWLGKPECRRNTPAIPLSDSFAALFS